MKIKPASFYSLLLIGLTLIFLFASYRVVLHYTHDSTKQALHHSLHQSVDQRIEKVMKADHIPGMSAALVHHQHVILNKGYGEADISKKIKADADTRYEIASNTKAFTGLAVLELAKQGKLKLDAPVSDYIPWLHFTYQGQKKAVTLKMLLAQTSGIDDQLSDDQEGEVPKSRDNLTGRVKSLNHAELQSAPGETFNYANNNYNILGLVIEKATGQSYEDYMHQHFLTPLQMQHSFFKTDKDKGTVAQGYVYEDHQNKADNPPYFKGDTPAAYLISSTSDLLPFVQMNLQPSKANADIIAQSHKAFTDVPDQSPKQGYGAGWFIDNTQHQVLHPGTLPNYSSMIILDTKDKNAVILLANLNAPHLPELAENLMYQIEHYKNISAFNHTLYHHAEWLSAGLLLILVLFAVSSVILIQRMHHQLIKRPLGPWSKKWMLLIILLIAAAVVYEIWQLPSMIAPHTQWQEALDSFPAVLIAVMLFGNLALITGLICLIQLLYFKPKAK